MTKRDSQVEELLSPRVLRIDFHDVDMSMDPMTNYTSPLYLNFHFPHPPRPLYLRQLALPFSNF